MCSGDFLKDPVVAEFHRRMRYDRRKASYYLRGNYRRIGGKNCVYCGFKAQTGDHVPALFIGFMEGIVKGVVVSSCYECNKLLGSRPSTCLKERAALLASAYEEAKPYATKFVNGPEVGSEAREKAGALALKATRCRQRMSAINCNMLEGSAALFAGNGESGGENTSFSIADWENVVF